MKFLLLFFVFAALFGIGTMVMLRVAMLIEKGFPGFARMVRPFAIIAAGVLAAIGTIKMGGK